MEMLRDVRVQSILVTLSGLTALGWILLAGDGPAGIAAICGRNSESSDVVVLLGMWMVMSVTMMLPCATGLIIGISWEARPHGAVLAASKFTGGFLAVVAVAGILGGVVEAGFAGMGLQNPEVGIANPLLRCCLLAAAGLLELLQPHMRSAPRSGHGAFLRGIAHGGAAWSTLATMICLQLVGGAMNMPWSATVALWMLADAILPSRRQSTIFGATLLIAAAVSLFAS